MIKVLLVEDEENIRKGIGYMLDWEKLNIVLVAQAWNGKQGLEYIEEFKPDLVITDVRMPFVDGLEMIREGKNIHDFESIIISGFSEFDYAKEALVLGVSEYILKPIDYEELSEAIIRIKPKIKAKNPQTSSDPAIRCQSQKMKRIIKYIDDNLSQKLTLSDLCDIFEISSTSMNDLFKQEVNTTVNDFVNQKKINKAIQLIREEDYKIYEIAEMLGYSDYKYFNYVFKKYTDVTPSKFK